MRVEHLLIFLLLLASCNLQPKQKSAGDQASEIVIDTIPAEPEKMPFSVSMNPELFGKATAKQQRILTELFGKKQAIALLSGSDAMLEIKTDADLYSCYHFLDSVCDLTTEQLMKKYEVIDFEALSKQFEEIAPLLPNLYFTCVGECTMPRLQLDYLKFSKLARRTTGMQDDNYFTVMETCFGKSNFDDILGATWFSMTWDYGGNSMLGSGNHYKVLAICQKMKKNNFFVHYIEEWEEMCLNDALTWHTLYCTSEKAVAELKKIARLDVGKQFKKEVDKRITELENPTEELQLDCEHQDCSYG